MASEPNLNAYPAFPPRATKKSQGAVVSLPVIAGRKHAQTDVRLPNPLARSAGPLASSALAGGRWVQAAYVITDVSCAVISFSVVLMARYAPIWRTHSLSHYAPMLAAAIPTKYLHVLVLYTMLVVIFSQMYGLYRTPRDRSQLQEIMLVGKALAWSTALLMATLYLTQAITISRLVILASAVINLVMFSAWRAWKRGIIERRVAAGIGVRNVLIIGAGKVGREIADYFITNRHLGVVVKGFLDHNHVGDPTVLGRIENLAEICRAHFVDEVIITIPFMRFRVRRVLVLARLNNLDVKMVPDLYGSFGRQATLEYVGRVPVMSLRAKPVPRLRLILKRAMDIAGSALCLVFLSPVLAAIAVVVSLDSPGPVLYRACRVGKKGRKFVCYKFRTMVKNADALKDSLLSRNEREGATFKITDDPRITRVGGFLRRYSLDELPQLWNVLIGDMSLVGPRAHPVDDFQRYHLRHLRRLDVTPGLTGLWQVTARRDPSFDRNVELDLHYIAHWNLRLDLKILFQTVAVVFAGGGR